MEKLEDKTDGIVTVLKGVRSTWSQWEVNHYGGFIEDLKSFGEIEDGVVTLQNPPEPMEILYLYLKKVEPTLPDSVDKMAELYNYVLKCRLRRLEPHFLKHLKRVRQREIRRTKKEGEKEKEKEEEKEKELEKLKEKEKEAEEPKEKVVAKEKEKDNKKSKEEIRDKDKKTGSQEKTTEKLSDAPSKNVDAKNKQKTIKHLPLKGKKTKTSSTSSESRHTSPSVEKPSSPPPPPRALIKKEASDDECSKDKGEMKSK